MLRASVVTALVVCLCRPAQPLPAQSSAASALSDTVARAPFVRWAAGHARPLTTVEPGGPDEDLAPLDALVRRADIVGVGESDHNIREYVQLRQRILQRLARHGGVAAIAMETGLPEGRSVDAWLVGDTGAPPRFPDVLHVGYGRDAEMIALLGWVHDFNARLPRARRIRFYGVDMARDGGGSMLPALEPVWAYLERVDSAFARASRGELRDVAGRMDARDWSVARFRYDSLSPGARDSLRAGTTRLVQQLERGRDAYRARSTPEQYAWAARLARVAQQTEETLREGNFNPHNARDVAMAENLAWVLEREGARGRVLLFAHNLHVARAPIEGPIVIWRVGRPVPVQSLGQIVQRSLGARYVTIGTAQGRLASDTTTLDPTSIDAVLGTVGPPLFLLDVRHAGGDARVWLERPHLMRAAGTYAQVTLPRAFDAVVFVNEVRRATRVP